MKSNEGLIYPIFKFIFKFLDSLNIVEILKSKSIKKNRRIIVDIYIFIKWTITIISIFLINQFEWLNYLLLFIISYLFVFNTFTYIKYHIVIENNNMLTDQLSLNRRILLVFQSFLFMIFCYTFFYIYFNENFSFESEFMLENIWNASLYSGANSFISTNISPLSANNSFGETIVLSQITHTYIYISILIINTINKNG